jgi:hypothetical protein
VSSWQSPSSGRPGSRRYSPIFNRDRDVAKADGGVWVAASAGAGRRSTGLDIPVSFAAVAEAPYDFEDRLIAIRGLPLKRLTVVVPERHDLVLMKTLRGYQHDVEVIGQIHGHQPLVFEVLRSRWKSEMTHVVGDPRRINLNFVEVLDHLFGRERAEAVRRELGQGRGPER